MIPVKLDENSETWGIVELQGEIESRVGESVFNQFVGDLHFSMQAKTSNAVPILIIGHHILYGKSVTLDKPLAVLKKQKTDGETAYVVKALVKTKLVFKIRPKPIIASVPGV